MLKFENGGEKLPQTLGFEGDKMADFRKSLEIRRFAEESFLRLVLKVKIPSSVKRVASEESLTLAFPASKIG